MDRMIGGAEFIGPSGNVWGAKCEESAKERLSNQLKWKFSLQVICSLWSRQPLLPSQKLRWSPFQPEGIVSGF